MKVKGSDGYEHSVTSQGQGALNTVLGGLGTASFFGINAGNFLGGMNRGGGCAPNGADAPISRYEASMMDELAAKNSENALLKAQIYTDQQTDKKVGEAIAFVRGEMKELAAEVRAFEKEQAAINREQAVFNGVATSTTQCIKGQVDQLYTLTKLVVPNTAVCPGWGNVTITPAAAPATGA
jgi:hypothetical protein